MPTQEKLTRTKKAPYYGPLRAKLEQRFEHAFDMMKGNCRSEVRLRRHLEVLSKETWLLLKKQVKLSFKSGAEAALRGETANHYNGSRD